MTEHQNTTDPYFPNIPTQVDFNELELKILNFWEENQIFKKSVDNRSEDKEYIFYDGPPFANGLPHYGHILTGYVKDTVPRYMAMRGFRVERRFGWDCHGLPAETGAEKDLDISGKQEIEKYGIDKFNEHCRSSVLKYTDIWRELMTRLGRWVDFDKDYKTMNLPYMESILWVFKTLFEQGLIYEGNKVLHYCYRCQTPLSNFEAKMDDAYRLRKDLSVTVKFRCLKLENTFFIVWTTTPWTLPSNIALAVGEKFNYVVVEREDERYILAKECLPKYEKELAEAKIIKELTGKELVGMKYEPLFPYFKETKNGFQVYSADFVNTEDGTGIVHIAPAFGEDDAALGNKYRIEAPDPVDSCGCFSAEVTDFAGENVHEVNEKIVIFLKKQNRVIQKEWFEHNYPYCWRCDTPLIYKAIPSWYLEVTKIKDKMLKNNQQINWVPAHIKDGIFGKWLEGAKDWAISRNRYWGTPVPVWKCDSCKAKKVVGSIAEIEKESGKKLDDLHRPRIDKVTFKCSCGGRMQRVLEVLDCWFESGSMPYAQLHYPFENKDRFNKIFPADFIVEYISQTRGWFYTLIVLSSALFDKPPFLNSVVHGVIFAEDGRKMSKRLKNYPDPRNMLKRYGSDAMRFYLLSSSILAGKNINFSEEGVKEVIRAVILPVWNAFRFFITYANADKLTPPFIEGKESKNLLDRYILARVNILISRLEKFMENYELVKASKEIIIFIDVLNNIYIRRNRRRFWKSEYSEDKLMAYQTLYDVLVTLCRVCAPFLPFLSERIYKALTRDESVHLSDWPAINNQYLDETLMQEVEGVQQIVRIGRTIREKAGVKVREPRSKVTISGFNVAGFSKFTDWMQEELNVKQVELNSDLKGSLRKVIKLNFKALGPKLGKNMQKVLQKVKEGDYQKLENNALQVGVYIIDQDDYAEELLMPEGAMQTDDGSIMVAIDMTETEGLKQEGQVRDLVRYIQMLRKEADFDVSDRIITLIKADDVFLQVVDKFREYIMAETLSVDLQTEENIEYEASQDINIDGQPITIKVTRGISL